MRCEDIRACCAAFIERELLEQEDAAFREHIQHCEACREVVLREDPSRIFSLLSRQSKPPEFWRGFWNEIEENFKTLTEQKELKF